MKKLILAIALSLAVATTTYAAQSKVFFKLVANADTYMSDKPQSICVYAVTTNYNYGKYDVRVEDKFITVVVDGSSNCPSSLNTGR